MSFPSKILHADDDEFVLAIVAEAIAKEEDDTEIASCTDGNDLVDKVHEDKPDLILLDLNMPGIDGPTALQILRTGEFKIDTPIIFYTGYEDIKMQQNYEKLGVIGVVHKSIEPSDIYPQILSLWMHYKGEG